MLRSHTVTVWSDIENVILSDILNEFKHNLMVSLGPSLFYLNRNKWNEFEWTRKGTRPDLDKKCKSVPSKLTTPPSTSKVSFFSIMHSGSQMGIVSLRCKKKERLMSKYIFMIHSFHLFQCFGFLSGYKAWQRKITFYKTKKTSII